MVGRALNRSSNQYEEATDEDAPSTAPAISDQTADYVEGLELCVTLIGMLRYDLHGKLTIWPI